MAKHLKISRRSFIGNYVIALSILFLMVLMDAAFGVPDILFFLMIGLVFYFLFEPEYSRINSVYVIDDEKLTEASGIISKRVSIIPWRLVSKAEMRQGIFGRLFGYGDVFVSEISEAPGITIRGITNPRKVLHLVEEKITNVKG